MTTCAEIGQRIKALRLNAGLTQDELGKRMGVKRETVNKWESGVRDIKTQYTAELARVLHTTCDFLLTGVNAENVLFHGLTGLSNTAIENLKKANPEDINTSDMTGGISAFINDILESDEIQNAVQRYEEYSNIRQILDWYIENNLDDQECRRRLFEENSGFVEGFDKEIRYQAELFHLSSNDTSSSLKRLAEIGLFELVKTLYRMFENKDYKNYLAPTQRLWKNHNMI